MSRKKKRRQKAGSKKPPPPTQAPAPLDRLPSFPVAALLAVGCLYVPMSRSNGFFPLDDVYIHLAVARNLIDQGTLGLPGVPWAAVSTAPYWTLLIAALAAIGIPEGVGALTLSALSYVLAVAFGTVLFQDLRGPAKSQFWAFAVAFGIASAPGMLWSGLSGMETTTAAAMGMGALALWTRERPSAALAVAAAMSGFRPEGALLALILAGIMICQDRRQLPLVGGVLAGGIVPWLALNLAAGGSLLPNGFWAKAGVFGAQRTAFIAGLIVLWVPLPWWIGVSLAGRHFKKGLLSPQRLPLWLWPLATLLFFLVALPGGFQHYRYLVPVAGPLLVIGGLGFSMSLKGRWLPMAIAVAFVAMSSWQVRTMWQIYNANQGNVASLHGEVASFLGQEPATGVLADDLGFLAWTLNAPVGDLRGLALPEANVHGKGPDGLAKAIEAAPFPVSHVVLYPNLHEQVLIPNDWTQAFSVRSDRSIAAGERLVVYRVSIP